MQIEKTCKKQNRGEMALEQRPFIDAAAGEQPSAERIENEGECDGRPHDEIDSRHAMNEIFAQEALVLAHMRQHRAADEIARHHEEGEHRLMPQLEGRVEPPDIGERPMRRAHDVRLVDEHVVRVDRQHDKRAEPAGGLDELR
ncbi:hypothetical protein LNB28_12610 [Methylocystis sp. SB2]|nr:hypothetical protein [Methylocystis sp. SB2]ULO22998.1 hypothetical protein LNB28_12610 [Methylocystis sp. SB2]